MCVRVCVPGRGAPRAAARAAAPRPGSRLLSVTNGGARGRCRSTPLCCRWLLCRCILFYSFFFFPFYKTRKIHLLFFLSPPHFPPIPPIFPSISGEAAPLPLPQPLGDQHSPCPSCPSYPQFAPPPGASCSPPQPCCKYWCGLGLFWGGSMPPLPRRGMGLRGPGWVREGGPGSACLGRPLFFKQTRAPAIPRHLPAGFPSPHPIPPPQTPGAIGDPPDPHLEGGGAQGLSLLVPPHPVPGEELGWGTGFGGPQGRGWGAPAPPPGWGREAGGPFSLVCFNLAIFLFFSPKSQLCGWLGGVRGGKGEGGSSCRFGGFLAARGGVLPPPGLLLSAPQIQSP